MQSNEPMGAQGIGTVNFADSDFLVNGSLSNTKIKRDLLAFTKFKLSPGDKYIVYYVDQVGWNSFKNYVSDLQKRRIFKIRLMRVSDNGISEIKDSSFFSETQANMTEEEGKFSVYTENSSGGIAVLLELETIDYFQMGVSEKIDTSNLDTRIGKITIASKFESDVKLYGFKLDIKNLTDPTDTPYSKYVNIPASVGIESKEFIKFNLELHGFRPMNEYEFTAIPFSQFNLYNEGEFAKHINKVNFTFGKNYNLEDSAFESKTFKYYVDEDDVTLTFDSYLNTPNTIASCYIEFYDTWSNVSTIVKVDDHENGIQTTTIIPLSKELVTQNFSDTDIGGIPVSNLKTLTAHYADNEFLKAVLPTMGTQFQGENVIKADGKLRKNAFYIVRISLVEVVTDGESAIVNYYDAYRCMKTTQETNDYFTDPNVINMSAIDQNNIQLNYIQQDPDISYPQIKEERIEYNNVNNFTLRNGTYYAYKVSENTLSNIDFKVSKAFNCTTNHKYIFNADTTKFTNLFGIKTDPSYTITLNNLTNNKVLEVEDVIVVNGDGSLIDNIATESNGTITNVTQEATADKITINVSLNINTKRMGYATSYSKIENITGTETKTMWDTFHQTLKDRKVFLQVNQKSQSGGDASYDNQTDITWHVNGLNTYPYLWTANMVDNLVLINKENCALARNLMPLRYKNSSTVGYATTNLRDNGVFSGRDMYDIVSGDKLSDGPNVDIKTGMIAALYSTWGDKGTTLNKSGAAALWFYKDGGKDVPFLTPSNQYTDFSSLALIMRYKDSEGKYGFGFVPDPFVPSTCVTFVDAYKLFDHIQNVFTKLGRSIRTSRALNTYVADSIIYHDGTRTVVKLSNLGASIGMKINESFASKMIMKATGTALVDTNIATIKSYINSKISGLAPEFKNMEAVNGDVTTKISNKYFPKISQNESVFNIKLDDFNVTLNQNSINVMTGALTLSPSKLNDDLNERQDKNLLLGDVVAFDPLYEKYTSLFGYEEVGGFFYYKAPSAGLLARTQPKALYDRPGDSIPVLLKISQV